MSTLVEKSGNSRNRGNMGGTDNADNTRHIEENAEVANPPAAARPVIKDVIALHYQGRGSDKVWAAAVVEEPDGSAVMLSCWGRRGASLQSGVKPGKDSPAALKIYSSKRSEKLREGYQPIDATLYGIQSTLATLHPAIASVATLTTLATVHVDANLTEASAVEASALTTLTRRSTGSVEPPNAPRVIVSHVTPINDTQLTVCMADPAYGVTEKVNGTRCVVEYEANSNSKVLRAYNRRGQEQPAVPEAAQSLIQLGCSFLIDGERMEGYNAGEYVMFDLLEWQGADVRSWPYYRRISTLENALRDANLIGWGGDTVARAGQVLLGPQPI